MLEKIVNVSRYRCCFDRLSTLYLDGDLMFDPDIVVTGQADLRGCNVFNVQWQGKIFTSDLAVALGMQWG